MHAPATTLIRDVRSDDEEMLREIWSSWSITTALARVSRGELIYLVAELDREVVGQLVIDPNAVSGTAYVFAISVRSTLQSQGIGTLLIKAAEQRIMELGFSTVTLKVEHSNPRAQALYERLGYTVTGDGFDEWDDCRPDGTVIRHIKVATWLMRKDLPSR